MLNLAATLIVVCTWRTVLAAPLSLTEAEALALRADPALDAYAARAQALEELEVAAAELPDPKLRFGVMSLPTDTFRLGQEPMTQLQLGVMQEFPRGQTRALRSERIREQGQATSMRRSDAAGRTRAAVREAFIDVLEQRRLAEINRTAESAFRDLLEITEDYYATGRVPQQDVLRAAVELTRVEERGQRLAEAEERARSRLGAWIGTAAWDELHGGWPSLPEPLSRGRIVDSLSTHPRIQALQAQVLAAETTVAIAKEAYKPGFAVDLAYGARRGDNPDGTDRPDLLTFMVSMDLPLFSKDRQDRVAAARIAESVAATMDRDDMYRKLRAEVESQARSLESQRERLRLFEHTLLPQAAYNSAAALDAYQQALSDLTTLMRARITELELQLDHVRLQAEALRTQARVLYLQGGVS